MKSKPIEWVKACLSCKFLLNLYVCHDVKNTQKSRLTIQTIGFFPLLTFLWKILKINRKLKKTEKRKAIKIKSLTAKVIANASLASLLFNSCGTFNLIVLIADIHSKVKGITQMTPCSRKSGGLRRARLGKWRSLSLLTKTATYKRKKTFRKSKSKIKYLNNIYKFR